MYVKVIFFAHGMAARFHLDRVSRWNQYTFERNSNVFTASEVSQDSNHRVA